MPSPKRRSSSNPQSSNAKLSSCLPTETLRPDLRLLPSPAAAKAQGIIIYCIGLIGSDGLDIDALNEWATDPDASHVAVTPDAADLEKLFAELAANISKTGATNIVIDEIVNPTSPLPAS